MPDMHDLNPTNTQARLKLFACEIFYRELCASIAASPNIIDAQFLTQGLHDLKSERMAERIQKEINAVDPSKYSAILLGFALCNNGVVGLTHPTLPIIVPRSHDCIALFMGSRDAYNKYFNGNPGTYYKTAGWFERDHENLEDTSSETQSPFGPLRTFESYVERYGEENARYLMETLGTGLQNYTRMTYIDLPGLAPLPYAEQTKDLAERMGFEFDHIQGDMGWLRRLIDGPWSDDEFLIVPPGKTIQPSYTDNVLCAS